MSAIAAHPLQWPAGWKRTDGAAKRSASFTRYRKQLSIADGVARVQQELERLGVSREDTVISTNVETRLDGLPRSDRAEPADAGAAVYWRKGSSTKVMAIDQYTRVADNLAAIAATLEAMRAIERHGGAAILERAFAGFAALPAPTAARSWREVLGFALTTAMPSAEVIRERYRSRASSAHPDKGGSDAEMAELNAARDAALKELE
jgi:hypothetical protein